MKNLVSFNASNKSLSLNEFMGCDESRKVLGTGDGVVCSHCGSVYVLFENYDDLYKTVGRCPGCGGVDYFG